MAKLIKIRVPMIVTGDGKWAASGSHRIDTETVSDPDWQWLDEMCDHDKPTINPRRFWIETVVELPETETVTGAAIPESAT